MIAGITGAHWLFYSKEPEADREFFRDVVGLRAVNVGGGWLIFALPPSELAVHPGKDSLMQRDADRRLMGAVLYLMCEDIRAAVKSLKAYGVPHAPIAKVEWGRYTILRLPSGGEIGLYQPSHVRAA